MQGEGLCARVKCCEWEKKDRPLSNRAVFSSLYTLLVSFCSPLCPEAFLDLPVLLGCKGILDQHLNGIMRKKSGAGLLKPHSASAIHVV